MAMLKVSLLNLLRRKSRTLLALLGIAIGIMALTTLVSLVDGLYADTTDVIGKLQGINLFSKSVPDPAMGIIEWYYSYIYK